MGRAGCIPRRAAGSHPDGGSDRRTGTGGRPGSRWPTRSCRRPDASRRRTRRRFPSNRRIPGAGTTRPCWIQCSTRLFTTGRWSLRLFATGFGRPYASGLPTEVQMRNRSTGSRRRGGSFMIGSVPRGLAEERLRLEEVAVPHAQHDVLASLGKLGRDVAAGIPGTDHEDPLALDVAWVAVVAGVQVLAAERARDVGDRWHRVVTVGDQDARVPSRDPIGRRDVPAVGGVGSAGGSRSTRVSKVTRERRSKRSACPSRYSTICARRGKWAHASGIGSPSKPDPARG